MSIIGVVGVPSGIYQILQTITGHTVYKFNRKQDKLLFYARVNPITTLFYSMLWCIPVVLAISDCIGGKKIEWEHTQREGELDIVV
jgi:hypothetical protein